MNITFLSRNDNGFDSIAWAFETHVMRDDIPEIGYALLHGNEDSPDRIEFYTENHYDATPFLTWTADEEGREI